MGRAFPPHPGCPVPSVSAITGELVSSCRIDPPADPIFNFPIFAMPIPNPPSFNFGCYRPSATANVAFNQPVPYFSATVKFPRSSDTGNCEPKFRFNVGFPAANCPDISASGSIHLLPPGHSPSLNLKVHKNSDTCAFNFKLEIGIPGGQCTSVSAGSTDAAPPPDLHDGDDFSVLTGVMVSEDDSGACTEFKLQFNRVKFTLDILDAGVFSTTAVPGVDPTCCTQFTVVTALGPWTNPLPGFLDLAYTTKKITIPTAITGIIVGTPADTSVPCGTAFTILDGIVSVDADETCTPCGMLASFSAQSITIEPPTITVGDTSGGSAINLATGAHTSDVVTGLQTAGTPCAPEIDAVQGSITAGGTSCTFTVVCSVSCSGGSLVVTTLSLTFANGILTTTPCSCA